MSDIQTPLVVLQQRMQQRQILAMMGINQWVQPSSETMNIADISASANTEADISINTDTQPISSAISVEQQNISHPSVEHLSVDAANVAHSDIETVDSTAGIVDDESSINHYPDDAHKPDLSYPDQQSSVTYSFDTTVPDISSTAVKPLIDTVVQQAAISNINNADGFKKDGFKEENFKKVAPFDLQGGRYGDWVILVDIQALNNGSQKLWQNITQALSISCETTSFPICEGMDTAELANASLAGYVFKIGRSEEIRVASLTALPEGLEHPNLTTAPTLDEMLADSNLKRQLWVQLSSQR